MTAHIISLPTAAAEPVLQQKRGPGRWPLSPNVIRQYRFIFRRIQPKPPEQAPQAVVPNGLQAARDHLQFCENFYQHAQSLCRDARSDFLLAQQREGLQVGVMKSGSVCMLKSVSRAGAGS